MKDSIKMMPEGERPYEKYERYGVKSLSDAELLAVIIKSGADGMNSVDVAKEILKLLPARSNLTALNYLSDEQLMEIKGIGRVKAIQLKCVAELSKRMARTGSMERISFKNADSIAEYFMEHMRYLTREEVHAMFFDSKQMFIAEVKLFEGTINASLSSPREILVEALKRDAVSLIVCHNHPSGDPSPSKEDAKFTFKLNKACEEVGLKLWDHIVIGDRTYVSFRERGFFS
ncbi:MAG: DNA repair protein RadC [Lachnospiraceae bacterium]|nr:DNA repair protein RadC [Lachnospiraceae bacterium]